jgi:transposase InsO family protein
MAGKNIFNVLAQATVCFKLSFGEKLIGRRMMRERWLVQPISANEFALISS